jgi:hypothetical protein
LWVAYCSALALHYAVMQHQGFAPRRELLLVGIKVRPRACRALLPGVQRAAMCQGRPVGDGQW